MVYHGSCHSFIATVHPAVCQAPPRSHSCCFLPLDLSKVRQQGECCVKDLNCTIQIKGIKFPHSFTTIDYIIDITFFFSLKSMQNSYSLHFLSAVLFKQNSFFPSRAVCLEKARLKMAHSRACLNCSVQECCVLLSLLRGSDLKSYFIMSEGLSNHTGTLKSINRLQLNVPHWNSISWLSNTPGRWQTALNSHPKPTIPLLCSCSLLLATVLGAFNQIYQ